MEDTEIESEEIVYESMADYYEAVGMDAREWDRENWVQIRRESETRYGTKPAVYARRQTLLDPLKIERLRWKAYLIRAKNWERLLAICQEVHQHPDKEAFIPHDEEELQESITKCEEDGRPLSKEDIEHYSHPRRLHVQWCSDDDYVTYDDRFWIYEEPKHDKDIAMEVIAEAAHHGDWDSKVLPDRIKRSEDPAKLDIGRRYHYVTQRGHALDDRCYLFNELLTRAIFESGLIPEDHARRVAMPVQVVMNGRRYMFSAGRYGTKETVDAYWPYPNSLDEIVITGKIEPAGKVR